MGRPAAGPAAYLGLVGRGPRREHDEFANELLVQSAAELGGDGERLAGARGPHAQRRPLAPHLVAQQGRAAHVVYGRDFDICDRSIIATLTKTKIIINRFDITDRKIET